MFIALGLGFIYFLFIFLNMGGQILSNLVGFVFPGKNPSPFPAACFLLGGGGNLRLNLLCPAYESIKAIERPGTADDTQWLTYWVVFGFFNVIEFWSRTILYWMRTPHPSPRVKGL